MAEERRRCPRLRCHLPIRVYSEGKPRVIQTLTKDLSAEGAKIVTPTSVSDKVVTVEIDLGKHQAVRLHAKPVWSQAIPNSEQFYLGLSFQNIPDTIRQLLSRYLEDLSSRHAKESSVV